MTRGIMEKIKIFKNLKKNCIENWEKIFIEILHKIEMMLADLNGKINLKKIK